MDRPKSYSYWKKPWHKWVVLGAAILQIVALWWKIDDFRTANCNIKLSISSVRISLETARCGLGEEGAVGDRRGQAERAGQAAKILSISASKASSGVL